MGKCLSYCELSYLREVSGAQKERNSSGLATREEAKLSQPVWSFDPAHTSVEFRIRHAAISWIRGSFSDWNGTLDFDPSNPAAVGVSFTVNVASVDTGVHDRDEHLRSADFFDAERFPTMTFRGTRALSLGEGGYSLVGDLTLHGVTRQVEFDVTYPGTSVDPWGVVRAGFEAKTVLDRRDFGLVWNKTMEDAGFLVGDTVEVTLEVEAIREQA